MGLLHLRPLTISTKLMVYNAVVIPTLLYGCEAWTLYRRQIKRLESFHCKKLRCIKWDNYVPKTTILQSLEHQRLSSPSSGINVVGLDIWSECLRNAFPSKSCSPNSQRNIDNEMVRRSAIKCLFSNFGIPHSTWEVLALDRSACLSAIHSGLRITEAAKREKAEERWHIRKFWEEPKRQGAGPIPSLQCPSRWQSLDYPAFAGTSTRRDLRLIASGLVNPQFEGNQ